MMITVTKLIILFEIVGNYNVSETRFPFWILSSQLSVQYFTHNAFNKIIVKIPKFCNWTGQFSICITFDYIQLDIYFFPQLLKYIYFFIKYYSMFWNCSVHCSAIEVVSPDNVILRMIWLVEIFNFFCRFDCTMLHYHTSFDNV